ncbi:hypothetical protein JCM8208_003053 [Rhodotorula glutinis]
MPLRALDPALRHTARAATTALRPSRLSAQPAFFHDAQRSIGQVWLPDMARIEAVAEAPVAIPMAPDAYRTSASSSSPAQPAGEVTTVASRSTHLGSGPSSTGSAAQ